MGKPLKIACIGARGIPSSYSGIEKACEGLYSSLAMRGHDITVYCRPEYVAQSPCAYRGVRLRSAPTLHTKSLDTLSHVAASLTHALIRERYDLIHLHALAPGIFSPLCRLSGVPTVATVHGLDWQRAKWKGVASVVLRAAERSIVKNVDQILVVSRDLQSYFRDRHNRATTYMPNGVETPNETDCHCTAVLKEFTLEPNGYLLYLGRLVPEKRIDDLILAFRRVQTCHKLVITGEGGYTDPYVAHLHRLATSDPRVVFTGLQNGPAVHTLLRNAALFVLPSELEGLPMALLECMQHGTPAVVSDIPPHRELLGGIPGFDLFFQPHDVAELHMRLHSGLALLDHYRTVARSARDHVLNSHSWPALALRTENIFYQTLELREPTSKTASSSMPRFWERSR